MSATAAREPVGVPGVLADWIERWAGGSDGGDGAELVARAMAALGEACAHPGRQRRAAEALLAADSLLTSALHDAARSPDPYARLTELLNAVVREAESEGGASK